MSHFASPDRFNSRHFSRNISPVARKVKLFPAAHNLYQFVNARNNLPQNIILTRRSLSQLLKLCGRRGPDALVAIAAPDVHAAPLTLQQQVLTRV